MLRTTNQSHMLLHMKNTNGQGGVCTLLCPGSVAQTRATPTVADPLKSSLLFVLFKLRIYTGIYRYFIQAKHNEERQFYRNHIRHYSLSYSNVRSRVAWHRLLQLPTRLQRVNGLYEIKSILQYFRSTIPSIVCLSSGVNLSRCTIVIV